MANYPTLNLPPQAIHVLRMARCTAAAQSLYWREPTVKWDADVCGLVWKGAREYLLLVRGATLQAYRPGRTRNGPQMETMGDALAGILWALEGDEYVESQ